jgi:hypothetical protein
MEKANTGDKSSKRGKVGQQHDKGRGFWGFSLAGPVSLSVKLAKSDRPEIECLPLMTWE